jgi:hypothetical protein
MVRPRLGVFKCSRSAKNGSLNSLGVSLDVKETPSARAKKGSGEKTIDLVDQVLSRLKNKKP